MATSLGTRSGCLRDRGLHVLVNQFELGASAVKFERLSADALPPTHQVKRQLTMIPARTSLPPHLYPLLEDLTLAKSHLEGANSLIPILQSDTPELAETISDALTGCLQALSILDNLSAYSDGGIRHE